MQSESASHRPSILIDFTKPEPKKVCDCPIFSRICKLNQLREIWDRSVALCRDFTLTPVSSTGQALTLSLPSTSSGREGFCRQFLPCLWFANTPYIMPERMAAKR